MSSSAPSVLATLETVILECNFTVDLAASDQTIIAFTISVNTSTFSSVNASTTIQQMMSDLTKHGTVVSCFIEDISGNGGNGRRRLLQSSTNQTMDVYLLLTNVTDTVIQSVVSTIQSGPLVQDIGGQLIASPTVTVLPSSTLGLDSSTGPMVNVAPSSSSQSSNIGAIVGGVIGGLLGACLLILIGLYWKNRKNLHLTFSSSAESSVDPHAQKVERSVPTVQEGDRLPTLFPAVVLPVQQPAYVAEPSLPAPDARFPAAMPAQPVSNAFDPYADVDAPNDTSPPIVTQVPIGLSPPHPTGISAASPPPLPRRPDRHHSVELMPMAKNSH